MATVDELLAAFRRLMPPRVAELTELWLHAESGDRDALAALRRLLHTLKGEAMILSLGPCAALTEAAEHVVDAVAAAGLDRALGASAGDRSQQVGDAMLGAFEMLGFLATDDAPPVAATIDALLETRRSIAAPATQAPPAAGALPAPPDEAVGPKPDRARVQTHTIDVETLEPIVTEVRRLLGEQSVLHPRLREIQRLLRLLRREIDPRSTPEELAERIAKTLTLGADIERRLSGLSSEWSASAFSTDLAIERLEEIVRRASVVPLSRLEARVHRVARSTAQALGRSVRVVVHAEGTVDAAIEQRLVAALQHLVRNAVDHGIEPPDERRRAGKPDEGRVHVAVSQTESNVRVVVEDDGRGIALDALRERLARRGRDVSRVGSDELLASLFEHGFTTREQKTALSGRGLGLDVVATELSAVGGRIQVETTPGMGTRFVVVLPATLRIDVALPVRASTLRCAIPGRVVQSVVRVEEITETTDGPMLRAGDGETSRLLPVRSLARLLGMPGEVRVGDTALVLDHPSGPFALTVDSYEDPRPVAAHDERNDLAFTSPFVRAVAPTPDGDVLLILDVTALREAAVRPATAAEIGSARSAPRAPHHVLVVEDAPVARELVCGILRSFGLRVSDAIDGQQGLDVAHRDRPDLIIADIEMPVLDGLSMIAELRRDPQLRDVPVIVLTTRTEEETRERARALGVRGFIPKRRFVESELRELIDACLETSPQRGEAAP